MRWMTWGMVVALGLAFGRGASAQPAPEPPKLIRFAVALHVELGPGAERCPDASYLRRAVVDEMGYDPFAPGATWRPAGTFDVKVARTPGGLEATTSYVDDASVTQWTRRYRDRTTTRAACESVYRGVALQIETQLTKFADDAPEPKPEAAAPACPAPSPCPACPPASPYSVWPPEWPMAPLRAPTPDPPKPLDRWPFAVRLGVATGPELIVSGLGSLGVSADVGVRYRAVSFGVEAHGDPPIGSLTYPAVGSVTFARMSAALLVCAHYGWFAGCAFGDVGRFIFPGHVHTLPPSGYYAAAGVRAGVEVPVAPPRVFVRTMLDLRAPIDPATYTYTATRTTIFAPAGIGVGLGLGALVELGR
jgi:hypothetical protein